MRVTNLFLLPLVTGAMLLGAANGVHAADPTGTASGIDRSGQDPSKAPGDDFNAYANGGWERRAQIPADQEQTGGFFDLVVATRDQIRSVIEASGQRSGPAARQIADYYKSFMDEAQVESLGAAPLAADLAEIRAIPDHAAMARLMGASGKNFLPAFFGATPSIDRDDPAHNILWINQAGTTLPLEYYLEDGRKAKLKAYRDLIARSFALIDWPNPETSADAVIALETKVAKVSWTSVQQRDTAAMNNHMSVAGLEALAPSFPWRTYLAGADLGQIDRVLVGEKSAFPKIAEIFAAADLDTLKAYMASGLVMQSSSLLPKRFVDSKFLMEQAFSGTAEPSARWKKAVGRISGDLSDAVGEEYVARYFPPEYKQVINNVINGLKTSMRHRIEAASWMSPATKERALAKLVAMRVMVGYPDKWQDASALRIDPADLYGNAKRSTAFYWERSVRKLTTAVDPNEWEMPPHVVNAYSDPARNVVVFPAAILQKPFFDPKADPAINYGGIGAIIGHEITHEFDDQGRHYDAQGKLSDWWRPEDSKRFEAQAARLGKQYDAIEVLPGVHVNGALTMGENIADLGGLLMALDAYHASLGGKPAPVLDGLTGDQRFFLAYAEVWRIKQRDDAKRANVVGDSHSPPVARVNGVVRNVDAWYAAFGVTPRQRLYLAPSARIRLW